MFNRRTSRSDACLQDFAFTRQTLAAACLDNGIAIAPKASDKLRCEILASTQLMLNAEGIPKPFGGLSPDFSAQARFERVEVHAFGSSVNGFGDETSDIDLVLDVPEVGLRVKGTLAVAVR